MAFNEGGAKSDVWRRIITGVIGVPSTLIKDRTGAPLGDAMLLEPDDRNHQIYQEFSGLYESIYSHAKDGFKSLHSLLGRTSS